MAQAIPVGPAPITRTSKRPSFGILFLDTHVSGLMHNRRQLTIARDLVVIIRGLPLSSGAFYVHGCPRSYAKRKRFTWLQRASRTCLLRRANGARDGELSHLGDAGSSHADPCVWHGKARRGRG